MKPTNEELENMGFNTYSEKQKADTLAKIPKIDTTLYSPVSKNNSKQRAYTFLDDIAELLDVCRNMPIDPWKVAEIACQALENSIINTFGKGEEE